MRPQHYNVQVAAESGHLRSLLFPRILLAAELGVACTLVLLAGSRAEFMLRFVAFLGAQPPAFSMQVLRFESLASAHSSWTVATTCALFAIISLGVRRRTAYFVSGAVACFLVLVVDQAAWALLTHYLNAPQVKFAAP